MAPRLDTALKAVREIGLLPTGLNALYRLGLASGYWRLRSPAGAGPAPQDVAGLRLSPRLPLPAGDTLPALLGPAGQDVLVEAEEILNGRVRLYGGPAVELRLQPDPPLRHWSQVSDDPAGGEDIKDQWEPARFGWAFTLARAYRLNPDERYPAAFWDYLETFLRANPPNLGPNWVSAQEAALRILALTFAAQVFSGAPGATAERLDRLAAALVQHGQRIPLTLIYARSQNNNHLFTEAAGLYTLGVLLKDWPAAQSWRNLGWKWLTWALRHQIEASGEYVQHSMNYHRLMLHTALWVDWLNRVDGAYFPDDVQDRLAAATRWIFYQMDPTSGETPNLGHNDGANILPLAGGNFRDYRPVVQAAGRAFLGADLLPPGPWDELSAWLGLEPRGRQDRPPGAGPALLRLGDATSWATLRAATYTTRPAHADQLIVDLWWHGQNVTLDAGTYRYTAPAPWKNTLAGTRVHNTVIVEGQDQMQRAGRFLWLDWAQAQVLPAVLPDAVAAQHNGYARL
ncbi:MAG: hypothetical protein GYA17_07900, partial [Chloroflexi bacterium]|nr:hypothetical protein [Chloroflexota bacterium]